MTKKLSSQYIRYLSTAKWKQKREQFINTNYNNEIDRACGDNNKLYMCDRCGWNFCYAELEVHHKHYDTLGAESRCDVLVVCHTCHALEDKKRVLKTDQRNLDALDRAQFEGWLQALYGVDYQDLDLDLDIKYEEFCAFIEKKW